MGDTNGGVERRRLTTRDLGLAGLAAIMVLALSGAGAHRSRLLVLERRVADDEAALAQVATGLGVDIQRGLRAVALAAHEVPTAGLGAVSGSALATSVPGATAIGFVPAAGSPPSGAGPPVLSADDRARPAIAALLDRARDAGVVQLGPTVDLGDGSRALLAAAVYGVGFLPGEPRTSSERRARIAGWVVAQLDLEAIASTHAPAGAVVTVEDAGARFGDAALARGADLPEQELFIEGRVLRVRAGTPGGVAVTAPSVALIALGCAVALAAAAAVLTAGRRLREQEAAAAHRAEQVRLIGAVAPLVQQSLDLGEVLPAVAVQLSDHFGLRGVALSTGSSRAGQTELFSIGDAPAPNSEAVLHPPAHVAAGETLALALQRGGRSVALLQIVAGRPLGAHELETLRALTELVAAAMVNASLYASQQEALHRLRELDGLKTVFLGTASHELRTPATAIGGFASLLVNSWDAVTEEQRRDFAERIAANARSLSAVVQDLLDFSLLDRGGLTIALQPVDLGALVESVVRRLEPAFGDREVSCTVRPAPRVAGDPDGLERVTTNLLTNAVKFSPNGSTIDVSVVPAGDGASLIVSDQGPGVPADEREQVFARFYRGAGDAVVQTRGVGIGLSVVAELVSRMRGEVTVDDAPGGGARFTVRLPASRVPDQEESEDATLV